MQTNGFYVNGACGSLLKKQIISSFISVTLIKYKGCAFVCVCVCGEWRGRGCVIDEAMIASI